MIRYILVCLGLAVLAGLPAAAQQPIDIGSRLELFVDDYLVDQLTGAARFDLKKPEARDVALVTDAAWEGNVSGYFTLFQDGPIYRMYYRGFQYDPDGSAPHPQFTCYAESTDGINWTKPNLGLVEFQGSTANNIIWDGTGVHNFAPFKDANPDCEPDAKYKAVGRGRVREPVDPAGLYAFKSPDGIHWSMMSDKPIITDGAFDSQNLAFWDTERECYVDYHRDGQNGVRAIKTAVSDDFLQWSAPSFLQYPPGTPDEHLYTNAILPYQRAPHLRLGFPTRYDASTSQVEPILMSSRDGVNFQRWSEALIPTTAPEDRDGNRSNYMAWGLLQLPHSKRELSVYATEAYYEGTDSRIRRFTYRVDGFVSVRAENETGKLLTKSLVFDGDRLQINFATFDQGTVRVELQDTTGNALPGYSLEESLPITGDQISQTISWQGGSDLGDLAGTPVRILFELNNTDLYSFQFTSVPEPATLGMSGVASLALLMVGGRARRRSVQ